VFGNFSAVAFCTETAIHSAGKAYRTVHENARGLLLPHNSLVDGDHEWVVYNLPLTWGGKQFLVTVTAVNAEWLLVRSSSTPPVQLGKLTIA
jgi:hypothetical protein